MDNQHLQYVCAALVPSQSEVASGISPSALDPTVSETEAFTLHSRPGASKVIHLHFKGGTTTNTRWNSGIGAIKTPAFSTDADTTTFSANDLAAIVTIFRGVAEDFSAFDVDVTTGKSRSEGERDECELL